VAKKLLNLNNLKEIFKMVGLIFGIIVFIIGIVASVILMQKRVVNGYGSERTVTKPFKKYGVITLVCGIFLAILLTFFGSIVSVDTGHVGVVKTFGKVEDYTFDSGFHFKAPWNSVTQINNQVQKTSIELPCFSKDIQVVNTTYTVNYQISKGNAQNIYRDIGINYLDTVVNPTIQETVKTVIARYSAEDLIGKRAEVAAEIEDLLTTNLQKYNIDVSSTAIENMDFTDTFTAAVEAKAVAAQNKLQAQIEQDRLTMEAQQAFVDYCTFFSDYGFELSASFVNRFRTGEMPIGISYYTEYNTLSVFAPEITGLWDFAPMIGHVNENGEIDNTSISATSSVIMFEDSKLKQECWEYMKWWTAADTQITYARLLEGLLGPSARYNVSNIEAFEQLPWSRKEYKILSEAMANTAHLPVVPGSYILGRYVDNAFRAVINDKVNPRMALYDNVRKINVELERKREEFGLN
jgi:hypothetical protein